MKRSRDFFRRMQNRQKERGGLDMLASSVYVCRLHRGDWVKIDRRIYTVDQVFFTYYGQTGNRYVILCGTKSLRTNASSRLKNCKALTVSNGVESIKLVIKRQTEFFLQLPLCSAPLNSVWWKFKRSKQNIPWTITEYPYTIPTENRRKIHGIDDKKRIKHETASIRI